MVEAHVAEYKKKIVKDFTQLMQDYPIVGVVDMENMPAQQLQIMRAQLRDMVVLRMTKRRFIKIALDAVKDKKKGIETLNEHLRGMPALLFTKENPFKVYRTLQKNKSKAPAKGGQTAPNDILVTAGATSFAPGPIIGELGSLGLKTGVEDGKVAIKEDKVVVKEGEVIPAKTAELLTRLGIQPMEVGLDLIAVYEDGTIYKKDVLAIDEVQFSADVNNAARWAFNLSVEACYTTKDNIELLITKSFRESKYLALEQNILADLVVEEVLAKAERQMLSLKDTANIEVTAKPAPAAEEKPAEEVKEEVKEEKPEVKEEPKAEEPTVEKKEEPVPKAEPEKKEEPAPEPTPEPPKEEPEAEPPKEEPAAPEPEKPEEIPKEEPKEEAPQPEEKVEEPKPEEETPKEEEKPEEPSPEPEEPPTEPEKTEEAPKEEPKAEEQPVAETKGEPEEETPKEEPKVEEKAPQPEKPEEIPKEDLFKLDKPQHGKVEDILPQDTEEDIEEHIKEEIKAEKKELTQDIKQAEKDIEKLPPEKQEEAKEQLAEIKQIEEDALEVEKERKKTEVEEAENLFDQLKKKGTLRDVPVESKKSTKKKVIKKQDDVPTAHELAARRKKTQS